MIKEVLRAQSSSTGSVVLIADSVWRSYTWCLILKSLLELDVSVWNMSLKFYTNRPIFLFIKILSVGLVLQDRFRFLTCRPCFTLLNMEFASEIFIVDWNNV